MLRLPREARNFFSPGARKNGGTSEKPIPPFSIAKIATIAKIARIENSKNLTTR